MTTSEQINEIAPAFCKAQSALKPAVKDADNSAFRSKYADLASCWAACQVPLSVNGLSVAQDPRIDDTGVHVTTRLIHSSGQWFEFGPLTVPLTKKDAHGVGSGISYARRYGLSAALGIVAGDDDGNLAAAGKEEKRGVKVEASRRVSVPKGAVQILSTHLAEWGGDIIVIDEHGVETDYKTKERRVAERCEQLAQEHVPVVLLFETITRGKNQGKVKVVAVSRWRPEPVQAELPAPVLTATDIPF